ncbi:hypothetical protein TPHA_0D03000 [Tetrapisispora phaffii CBS 4417]|uniref:Peptidase S54 rhomboid domain-containing protein n=1 Tax=Tetrapisispora phaffii (strain ATCC 24235 / CBS 4417 / NBRC 1672 / NRRL Y-8282 / UCD 70-5) TaxID=1071381 RepID=G8BSW5_TETPH|nr:hypothetical protein TPHA_0D03000 [Tetrapisispora phaffii CBS 4417]CCE62936.1 hypothetical protein TPHA_0D03000 [Tetrapisispora phaffii CBS 4417]
MVFMLTPIGRASMIRSLASQRLYFTNNLIRSQRNILKSSFWSPNIVLRKHEITKSSIINQLLARRTFSTKATSFAKWNSNENTASRYLRLNRFQQFQHLQGNNNSLGKVTLTAVALMTGIFFLSPYIFEYVPPFTHFKKNPTHLIYTLLGINAVVFMMWQSPKSWRFLQRYMLLEKSNIYSKWSLIGSAFSHQEFWHLGMNMLALWSFGTSLATMLGVSNFFSLYMNSAIVGSLFSLWYPKIARIAMIGPSLGASGALFGVFGCFAYLFPKAKLLLFFFPIPGGAWVAFLGAVGWNLAGCVLRWGSFDYAAHLGGSAIGVFYGWYISKIARQQRDRRLHQQTGRWF